MEFSVPTRAEELQRPASVYLNGRGGPRLIDLSHVNRFCCYQDADVGAAVLLDPDRGHGSENAT